MLKHIGHFHICVVDLLCSVTFSHFVWYLPAKSLAHGSAQCDVGRQQEIGFVVHIEGDGGRIITAYLLSLHDILQAHLHLVFGSPVETITHRQQLVA